MADWYHSIMFHLPPLVSMSEMTGSMPDVTGVWHNEHALGSAHPRDKQQRGLGVEEAHSVCEIIRDLTRDECRDPGSSDHCSLSISNLHLVVIGMCNPSNSLIFE